MTPFFSYGFSLKCHLWVCLKFSGNKSHNCNPKCFWSDWRSWRAWQVNSLLPSSDHPLSCGIQSFRVNGKFFIFIEQIVGKFVQRFFFFIWKRMLFWCNCILNNFSILELCGIWCSLFKVVYILLLTQVSFSSVK